MRFAVAAREILSYKRLFHSTAFDPGGGFIPEESKSAADSLRLRIDAGAKSDRQARSMYRELFVRMPEPVFLLDAGTLAILDCSDAACEMYGYSRERLVGSSFLQLHSLEDFDSAQSHLQHCVDRDEYTATLHALDGSAHPCRVSVASTQCDGGDCRIATVRPLPANVTETLEVIGRQVPVVLWTTDTELRFTSSSGSALDLLGDESRSVIGMSLQDYFGTSEERMAALAGHRRALQGAPATYEMEYEGRVFDSHVEPMRAHDGSVVGVIGVAIDITERRRAEVMLRLSEERNRELVENALDVIYSHDLSGKFLAISPAAEQVTGYTREEALGMNIANILAPDCLEQTREVIRRKVEGLPIQRPYELDIIRRDGQRRTLEVNTKLVYRDGTPFAIQGIARDITDRRHAEKALRESESKFRAAAETASSAIFIYQDTGFQYVNTASEGITGYSTAELLRMNFWELVHPDHRELVRARGMARQREEAAPNRYEFKIIRKDGVERWLDYTAGVIEYAGNLAVLGTAFDVTDRKRTEEELQVQKAYLEELFQNAPEGIAVLNEKGHVLRANVEFLAMFGYSFDDVLGANIDDLIVPEEYIGEAHQLTLGLDAGESFNIETIRRRKDGTLIDVSILGTPINVARGQIGRYVIYRDITKQKRADRYREAQFAMTRILSESRTLDQALHRMLEATCTLVGWDFGRVWRVDAAADVLRLSQRWESPDLVAKLDECIDFLERGQYLTGTVWQDGEPNWIIDLQAMPELSDTTVVKAGLRSCFAVPIRAGGEIIGIMELFSRSVRDPDYELLKGMTDIGTQIGQFTERLRAEEALRESESKFRAVADTAASAIYIHAGDKFLYVNRASELISGYTRDELMKMSVWELAHPAERELMRTRAESRCHGNNVPVRYEFQVISKSGEARWLDFSAAVIQFEGESAILATAFDITERKRAEQMQSALYRIANLASTAEDLPQLYAAIHQIVGELMYAKNFYIALLDEAEQIITFPYFVDEEDEVPPPPQQRRRGLTDYVLRTGQPLLAIPEMFDSLVAAGEVEPRGAASLDWLGVPLKVGDRTFGVLTVQSYTEHVRFGPKERDILTFVSQQVARAIEHRRNQQALRTSEQRYRSQVQTAVYGIYRSSIHGRFLDVNPALVEMLGYDSAEELMSIDMARDLYADTSERARIIAEVGHLARVGGVETRWKRKDGRIITVRISGRAGLHYPGEPPSFEMIAEDITERRALEDQLRHSQKMEAVGRLAGGIAHDFNNLLTVIKGYSDLMVHELRPSDPMRSEVEEIRKAADRAGSLTRQLLAFSRRQVMAPKVLDLNTVVTNMDKLLRRLLGEDVELTTSLDAKLGPVKADPGQIEQVIMNLAVNARDAMPDGGELIIETGNFLIDENYSREHAMVKPGAYAMVAVSDNGVGMDAETCQHVFEPFFTTKELGKGTGLGLSTVYGIVKQSGGHIWVYSEPGQGTTFKVYLPIVDSSAASVLARQTTGGSYTGSETVLLVEDEDGVRALVREVLQRHGYRVVETRSGDEAISACERAESPFQLLLTDVVLAQMSGRELARRLTPAHPHLKVLFMSGYTEEAILHHGVLDPGTAFLQKPFTPTALARKVREVLDGKLSE